MRNRLTAAVLTPTGRGAVATIRVMGDLAQLDQAAPLFLAANGRSLRDQLPRRIVFGQWGRGATEDLVVSRLADDTLEIHCHGGDAAVRRILDDLQQQIGCAVVSWQQQRASGVELCDVECLDALSRATTERTAEILLEQSTGLLRRAFERLELITPGDGSPRAAAAMPAQDATSRHERIVQIDDLLSWADFGLHLTQPWNVVLTGLPNVGKSSLINRLLGYERAIVFDQPGTTRDAVTADTALEGWPVRLIDTAGLRDTAEELEAAGIALARQRLATADLRIVLVDVSEPPSADDERLLAEWPEAIVVAHKVDLPERWPDQWCERLPQRVVRVSSATSEGIPELQRVLVERLIPRVPPLGTAVPVNARQIELLHATRAALLG